MSFENPFVKFHNRRFHEFLASARPSVHSSCRASASPASALTRSGHILPKKHPTRSHVREPEAPIFGKKKFRRAGICGPCQPRCVSRYFPSGTCAGQRGERLAEVEFCPSSAGPPSRPQSRHGVALENATVGRRADAASTKGGAAPSRHQAASMSPSAGAGAEGAMTEASTNAGAADGRLAGRRRDIAAISAVWRGMPPSSSMRTIRRPSAPNAQARIICPQRLAEHSAFPVQPSWTPERKSSSSSIQALAGARAIRLGARHRWRHWRQSAWRRPPIVPRDIYVKSARSSSGELALSSWVGKAVGNADFGL